MIEAKDVTLGFWLIRRHGALSVAQVLLSRIDGSRVAYRIGESGQCYPTALDAEWICPLDLSAIAQKEETK